MTCGELYIPTIHYHVQRIEMIYGGELSYGVGTFSSRLVAHCIGSFQLS
jgi:hypothetical protein